MLAFVASASQGKLAKPTKRIPQCPQNREARNADAHTPGTPPLALLLLGVGGKLAHAAPAVGQHTSHFLPHALHTMADRGSDGATSRDECAALRICATKSALSEG